MRRVISGRDNLSRRGEHTMNQQTSKHRLPFILIDEEHNRLKVHDYDSGEEIPSFSGLARDYFVDRFVLVSTYPGFETEINYLVSDTLDGAIQEAEYLRAKFGIHNSIAA
jgi:hypothetical protein